MDFKLQILGTASAMPQVDRNQSAHVLFVHGRIFLIDCGEGTQRQLALYKISLLKIDAIFISHVHGDHVFGLFGLLSTMGMKYRNKPLYIYAPGNCRPLLNFFSSFYGCELPYEIKFCQLSMKTIEEIYSAKAFSVFAFPLNHKIETFGFLFKEKMPLYNIRKEAISEYSLTLTEIGTLKRGEDVIREDGSEVPKEQVTYRPYVPRSYAYCSDTATFKELSTWVKGVDLLYHETTYTKEFEEQAALRYHSTTEQAALCAKEAEVSKLIIGHYSARCKDASVYLRECKSIFENSHAASDGDIFELPLVKDELK